MLRLVSIVVLLCVSVVAQTAEKPQQAAAPVAKPSAELERLTKAIVGSWLVTSKIEPNEFMPGGAAAGTAEFYTGPGDLAVGQQYRVTGPTGEFVGSMLMWWDEKEKGFKHVWCDNMSGCRTSAGVARWEGDSLKGTDTLEMFGKQWQIRTAIKNIQHDSFVYEEEVGPVGGELKRAMIIQYTRVIPNPHFPGHHAGRR